MSWQRLKLLKRIVKTARRQGQDERDPGYPINTGQWLALASTAFLASYYLNGDPLSIYLGLTAGGLALASSLPRMAPTYTVASIYSKIDAPERGVEGEDVLLEARVVNRSFLPVIASVSFADSTISLKLPPRSGSTARHTARLQLGYNCVKLVLDSLKDPLGMWSISGVSEVLVETCILARPEPREGVESIPGVSEALDEASRLSRTPESLDYRSFREYQPGDEPRLIEWKLSGRRLDLVVKELEGFDPSSTMPLLVLAYSEASYTEPLGESPFAAAARAFYGVSKLFSERGLQHRALIAAGSSIMVVEVRGIEGWIELGYLIAGARPLGGIDWGSIASMARSLPIAGRPILVAPSDEDIPSSIAESFHTILV